jgi:hypothetical protein
MLTRRSWIASATAGLAACSLPLAARASATLLPYRSDAEMAEVLERWRNAAARTMAERRRESVAMGSMMAAAPAAKAMADSAAAPATESITNVQTAGVDEGGIVKRAGDFLVILRRGRLFTVRVGGDALQPVAHSDAYAPGSDPGGAWYDEMLIAGRTVVVIGYSYARGGTEVGLFELGHDGRLDYRATYHLRSFDYYSSRNYASRLIGSKLVFYTPTLLSPWGAPPMTLLPGWRRWLGAATPPAFQRILPATRVYRSDDDFDPGEMLALHTVTSIDLASDEPRVESTAVLGPVGRVFYVSAGSVYVWTAARGRSNGSAVFRLPLDGVAPTGLKTAGVPTDQLSFLEDASGHLNVLLRESGRGESMWGSESGAGSLALLRVPLADFGDGRGAARRESYRRLPGPRGALQNRFVGDWLLWGGAGEARAWALPLRPPAAEPSVLDPGHAIERIEAIGDDALVAGNAGSDLRLSLVRLEGGSATLAGRHVQPGVRQGETRTHGFFYRPTGRDEGLLGLPLLGQSGRRGGVFAGGAGSASVLVLRQRDLDLSPLGELRADARGAVDDACKASCVDWYGNARPIFLGERVFALLGYELVEGRLEWQAWRWGEAAELPSDRLVERRRISFAPIAPWREGRHWPFN